MIVVFVVIRQKLRRFRSAIALLSRKPFRLQILVVLLSKKCKTLDESASYHGTYRLLVIVLIVVVVIAVKQNPCRVRPVLASPHGNFFRFRNLILLLAGIS